MKVYFFILFLALLSACNTESLNSSLDQKVVETQEKPIRIKALSYNIHYGVGMDSKKDLHRIAKVINKLNPDIIGLQEVTDSLMTATLSQLTNTYGVFGASTEKETPNLYRLLDIPIPKSQLFYGDAILSKYPFEYMGNLSIPSASSSRYEAMCVKVNLPTVKEEKKAFRFVNTHFDYLETIGSQVARIGAVKVIESAFFKEETNYPAILTGDLNATPQSEPLQLLKKNGWIPTNFSKNLWTIPTKKPVKQIDYVLVRPKSKWRVIDVTVINEPMASDHLPILMTLELLP